MIRFLLLLLILIVPNLSAAEEQRPGTQETAWTIMAYLDGDNNLEHAAIMDMLEMEQGIPEDVQIIVLLDRHRQFSTVLGNATTTKLYRIRKAPPFDLTNAAIGLPAPLPSSFSSEELADWGEQDMADPKTLIRFIEYCAKNYPAKRYALIPWNHGSGVASSGMLLDEDGAKKSMPFQTFIDAVQTASKKLPNGRFDLIKYELCLMGQLDVMAETAKVADFAFASPPTEPNQGSDYIHILPLFTKDISTEELTAKMVDVNIDYYTKLGRPAAFAAYNLAYMNNVTLSLNKLSTHLAALTPQYFKELTRATCFATHYENIIVDLTRGPDAMSSVELHDWLQNLLMVPNVSTVIINQIRLETAKLVYHAKATPNLQECHGVTLYLPLRRDFVQPNYLSSSFAKNAGLIHYLQKLFAAQENLQTSIPQITNVELGAPILKPNHQGTSPTDFNITPLSSITPFSRNVVRFNVVGSNILLTKMLQFEQRGNERFINCEQLLTEHSTKKVSENLFTSISPKYNEGKTTLMREFSAKYKVTNGTLCEDISIINISASREIQDNISIGYGSYSDATTGFQEIFVQVQFSNRLRFPIRMIALQYNTQGGMQSIREIIPRTDGIFRPAVTVLDSQNNVRRVFGPPMPLNQNIFLLTTDMLEEG
ncbi:MAG: hypothetical protein IK079_00015, partial [Desulfovibrio sp.]|nr:hypothetical protein [Desulfovibrio sp.]